MKANRNCPKLTSFLLNLLQVDLAKIWIFWYDSDSNNVVTALLVEKPTKEDSTIIAIGDNSAADHVNVDDVCMMHIRAEGLNECVRQIFLWLGKIHGQNIKW